MATRLQRLVWAVQRWLGRPWERRLARALLRVDQVRHWESLYSRLSDEELRRTALQVRARARSGTRLESLLPEAYGLVCVAAHRTIGLRPFDVQIAGGVVMHYGGLAELATGEGKTLVATMPAFLNALTGKGVHITTVNDYLARRDAEWMGPIYASLGLTVGALQMQMPDDIRSAKYRCDITYGMASEFGFDFLRDRLRLRQIGQLATPFWSAWQDGASACSAAPLAVQRQHHYAIVDEADSILIDEARTPLIISTAHRPARPEEQIVYHWADKLARSLDSGRHFWLDPKKNKIELTEEGRQVVRWSDPPAGPHSHGMDKLYEHVERALFAHHRLRRDQHYLVEKDKVVIIDEFTGRRMPDRHWREGLHQAVEAKEGVPVTVPSEHAAQITFQSYFRLYHKLAGMTGTALPNAREFRRVYRLTVVPVPTHRPCIRRELPDQVFLTEEAKYDAVVAEVRRLLEQGRPVLIGTRSVDKSEKLSARLRAAGIEHQVLNARQHEWEAQVVARAGERGRVTIATNMAGRGTDIRLGPGVAEAGGLHVLGTERHEAARIDRQLAGRAARQGDPGSCQFFLCLEDELLEALTEWERAWLTAWAQRHPDRLDRLAPFFRRAQRRMERRHYLQRLDLMYYEKQRQEILKELSADPYVD